VFLPTLKPECSGKKFGGYLKSWTSTLMVFIRENFLHGMLFA
jgi:hypothetical protein